MSRTYRLLVSCDENGSTACHGVLEFRAQYPWEIDRLEGKLAVEQGWHVGVRRDEPDLTFDVCPACWPAVERRLAEWGRPGSALEVETEATSASDA